jgi:hypothetical protein
MTVPAMPAVVENTKIPKIPKKVKGVPKIYAYELTFQR